MYMPYGHAQSYVRPDLRPPKIGVIALININYTTSTTRYNLPADVGVNECNRKESVVHVQVHYIYIYIARG